MGFRFDLHNNRTCESHRVERRTQRGTRNGDLFHCTDSQQECVSIYPEELREHLHLSFDDRWSHRHLVELQIAVEQVDVRDRDALRIFGGSCLNSDQTMKCSECQTAYAPDSA
jgi:hypothetical protein